MWADAKNAILNQADDQFTCSLTVRQAEQSVPEPGKAMSLAKVKPNIAAELAAFKRPR